jgi:hypothetical protein
VTPDEDLAEQARLQAEFDAAMAEHDQFSREGGTVAEFEQIGERLRATDGLRHDYRVQGLWMDGPDDRRGQPGKSSLVAGSNNGDAGYVVAPPGLDCAQHGRTGVSSARHRTRFGLASLPAGRCCRDGPATGC